MKKILFTILILLVASNSNATYNQQYLLSQDTTFRTQVEVAMIQTSIAVASESPATAGHATRAAFAVNVLQNPDKWAPVISIIIASQNNNAMTPLTIPSTVSDTLISTAMNAQWGNMAGYFQQ